MLFLSFLASLSPLAFSRPMYTFVRLVTHYSCRLGLMVFFTIYTVNSLWPSSLSFSIHWASTKWPSTVFSVKNSFYQSPFQTLTSKCPKKIKIFTILIFIQVYSSNLWVNFGLQKLRILKNSKLESCKYLSHSSNPSSLVSIGFLRRKIHPKY